MMDHERVIALDVGCHPEAAISGAVLLQSETLAILTFNAMSNTVDEHGRYRAIGTAIVEIVGCWATQFGRPNDEGRDEHPLAAKGLDRCAYAVCEVLGSTWAMGEAARAEASARRIFGSSFERVCQGNVWLRRHFIVTFHDSTFECLAEKLSVRMSTDPFPTIIARLAERLTGSGA